MMNPPEMLPTDRLILRRPVSSDAEAVFAYTTDPKVMQYLSWTPSTDIAETRGFLDRCARMWESGDALVWAITLNCADAVLIGMIEARPSDNGVELGYAVNRSWWGHGYATEAVIEVTDWALSTDDVYRVWAYAHVENTASHRVLEKTGMTREGLLHRWRVYPNVSTEPSDSYMYARWR